LQAQQLNIRDHNVKFLRTRKSKVCLPVRESFTDQFSHNSGKSLIEEKIKASQIYLE
jgi:hypothetical protein